MHGSLAAELGKAKTQLVVDLLHELATNNGRGQTVGYYEMYFGGYKAILDAPKMWEAVSATDVQGTAKKFLTDTGKTTAVLVPKAEKAPETK